MDTYVRVRIYGVSRRKFHKAVEQIKHIASFVEEKLNYHSPESALSLLNMKGESSDTFIFDSVAKAQEVAAMTGGAYDPTVASVEELWDFRNGRVPPESAIKERLRFVGFGKVKLCGSKVILPENFKLDLGGIAKGIFLDLAYSVFLKNSLSGVVEAGGEILLCGSPFKGRRPWRVAIKNPRGDGFVKVIELKDGFTWFVATSGDYERFFIKNGVRYHHVLNPKTGEPATYAASATVVATSGYLADALATAMMVSPLEKFDMDLLKKVVFEAYIYREGFGLKRVLP